MPSPPIDTRPIALRVATSAGDLAAAATLFREYAASLDVDLRFQGFEAELAALPGDYAAPEGQLLLGSVDGELAACGAFRRLDHADHANACEMKRLYVRPARRKSGVGRALARRLVADARDAGYASMLLDTLETMMAARTLYASLGFVDVAPYYVNPLPGVRYLKASFA